METIALVDGEEEEVTLIVDEGEGHFIIGRVYGEIKINLAEVEALCRPRRKKKIIQIELTDSGLEELDKLKNQLEKTSYSETLRSSLKVTKFLEDAMDSGHEIILRDKKTRKEQTVVIK